MRSHVTEIFPVGTFLLFLIRFKKVTNLLLAVKNVSRLFCKIDLPKTLVIFLCLTLQTSTENLWNKFMWRTKIIKNFFYFDFLYKYQRYQTFSKLSTHLKKKKLKRKQRNNICFKNLQKFANENCQWIRYMVYKIFM